MADGGEQTVCEGIEFDYSDQFAGMNNAILGLSGTFTNEIATDRTNGRKNVKRLMNVWLKCSQAFASATSSMRGPSPK